MLPVKETGLNADPGVEIGAFSESVQCGLSFDRRFSARRPSGERGAAGRG